jgi:WD40 repeat protein
VRLGKDYKYLESRLSPDGKWVSAFPLSSPESLVLVPTGSGEVRRFDHASACRSASWFHNGRQILCYGRDGSGRPRFFSVELESGRTSELRVAAGSSPDISTLDLSPRDDRLAAADSDGEVWILSLEGEDPRRVAGGTPGYELGGWAGDGRHLYLYRIGDVPLKILRLDLDSGTLEPWKELTLEDLAGVVRIHPVQVTPDGRFWAFSYSRVLSDLYAVEGLR